MTSVPLDRREIAVRFRVLRVTLEHAADGGCRFIELVLGALHGGERVQEPGIVRPLPQRGAQDVLGLRGRTLQKPRQVQRCGTVASIARERLGIRLRRRAGLPELFPHPAGVEEGRSVGRLLGEVRLEPRLRRLPPSLRHQLARLQVENGGGQLDEPLALVRRGLRALRFRLRRVRACAGGDQDGEEEAHLGTSPRQIRRNAA